ncbi:MAG TPA: polyprenyl diphosphate synthase [Candidatus Paceibacterota bacterium]|jgi:undecaprenyl diphosphate synthase|nr:polyprenyl diphosphate synthase [Candidatus Paceibacterota bacterium]
MEQTPACVGIILDGNRRWAKEKGLPKLEGHREGLLVTLKNIIRATKDCGIPNLAVFLFSTENWSREGAEVAYLMNLFREQWKSELTDLGKEGVRVRFVGQRERFDPDLQKAMNEIEADTANNTELTLWACMSYGGRAEIVDAAKATVTAGEEITEESLRKHFWSAEMPDPDIIIRTSGEKRLSGFLLWQSAYSELFFIDKNWPDFSKDDLEGVLKEFAERERRHGK